METFDFDKTSEGHSLLITDIRFQPNSTIFATSSFDKTVKIWDAARVSFSLSLLSESSFTTNFCLILQNFFGGFTKFFFSFPFSSPLFSYIFFLYKETVKTLPEYGYLCSYSTLTSCNWMKILYETPTDSF